MMASRALPLALLLTGVLAAPAQAAFGPPVDLAHGEIGTGVAAATDAGGATTAVLSGAGGLQLVQRATSRAPWGALEPLPGKGLGRAVGPVVAAAGEGAAAVAWRIDTPKKYGGIGAMVRDPGGLFDVPVAVADAGAGGVRHPAIAVDREGRALLAYNTGTRAVHLSQRGGIAITLRGAHRSFGAPEVVDARPGGPPAVAVGADGRGIVAWLRDRRVWAVSVDVEAQAIGRVKALTGAGGYAAVRVAAGPGGAATVAFIARRREARTGGVDGYEITALRRPARGTFPRRPEVAGRVGRRGYVAAIALAADEQGRATLAWSPERFGNDRRMGVNGVTAGVRAAVAGAADRRFAAPVEVERTGTLLCDPPAVAAAAGHAVIAAACHDARTWAVHAATARGDRFTPTQALMTTPVSNNIYLEPQRVAVGIDAGGVATVLGARIDPRDPAVPTAPVVQRVLAATGR
jgi:hypothetical protein